MYGFGKSGKPHMSHAVALVLLGRDPALQADPEDAMNRTDAEMVTVEEAGLEEAQEQPVFGMGTRAVRAARASPDSGVCELMEWFLDGSQGQMETN